MPTLRRTPFNPNGSLVADPLDEIESQNRNASMRAAEASNSAAQNNAMSQLALARLKQSDYQFGQGRADNTAMFREKLAADQHGMDLNANLTREGWGHQDAIAGKQFDYLKGRDESSDRRHQMEFDFEHDVTKNPSLQIAMTQAEAARKMAEYAQEQHDREAKKEVRTDKAADAAPLVITDPEEQAIYNAAVGSGQAPSQANLGVLDSRKKKAVAADEADLGNIGSQLDDFRRRDVSATPTFLGGEEPSDEETAQQAAKIEALAARMSQAEGIPLSQAQAKVAAVVRAKVPRGPRQGWSGDPDKSNALYKALNWL